MQVFSSLIVWTLGFVVICLGVYQGLALAGAVSTPPLAEGIVGGLLPTAFGLIAVPLCTVAYRALTRR
jgi:biopolymer transport protein ExbB/TolQ